MGHIVYEMKIIRNWQIHWNFSRVVSFTAGVKPKLFGTSAQFWCGPNTILSPVGQQPFEKKKHIRCPPAISKWWWLLLGGRGALQFMDLFFRLRGSSVEHFFAGNSWKHKVDDKLLSLTETSPSFLSPSHAKNSMEDGFVKSWVCSFVITLLLAKSSNHCTIPHRKWITSTVLFSGWWTSNSNASKLKVFSSLIWHIFVVDWVETTN